MLWGGSIVLMDEIEALKKKIAARENKPGWKDNVDAMKRRLKELQDAN